MKEFLAEQIKSGAHFIMPTLTQTLTLYRGLENPHIWWNVFLCSNGSWVDESSALLK